MLSVINSEIPIPPELPKRKRGRPRKSSTVPVPTVPVPVIPKDTNYLSHAHKIVKAIMDLTRIGPFMERPDDSFFGLHDYYTVISRPIWIREICRKVGNREYFHLKELVGDVELMLENCYRFWGPNHRISRLGFMIENALEKTIKLLPENVRLCLRGIDEQEEEEKRKLEAAKKQTNLKTVFRITELEADINGSGAQVERCSIAESRDVTSNGVCYESKEALTKNGVAVTAEENKGQVTFEEEDPQMRRGFA